MNKFAFASFAAAGGIAVVAPFALSRPAARQSQDAAIAPNTYVGQVNLGGLKQDEAARQLRVWWETEKRKKLKLTSPLVKKALPEMTPGELGVTLDDAATVAALPKQSMLGGVASAVSGGDRQQFEPVFKSNGTSPDALRAFVAKAAGHPVPARVTVAGGQLIRHPEVTGYSLDPSGLVAGVAAALKSGGPVRLPVVEASKHVPDAALNQITDVVSQFSTRFSAGNRPRAWNIRLASSIIDGVVLMPGDRFSFNGVVGRRTKAKGFREAGVYINGQHDTGIGGGICQVSTTLFNAALFADLKIRRRSNHSLPVPYVPLGRDATVDYGNLDLAFDNTYSTPIAIVSHYVPGRLTFEILGKKDPSLKVKVIQTGLRTWDVQTETIQDPHLARGRRRVVKQAEPGRSVRTIRIVYRDGKEVGRETIGRSTYGGGTRVVAIGTAAPIVRPIPHPVVPPPAVAGQPTTPPPAPDPASLPTG